MSIYVCSDIHGQYNLFLKLLNKINFSKDDKLYILGDIIDKGSESLKLVDFIRRQDNIFCLMGNHELLFLSYYDSCMKEYDGNNENEIMQKLQSYFPNENFKISWEIIDYIESLPFFVETEKFIGVHAGFKTDDNGKILPLKTQDQEFMVYDRSFKDKNIINPFGKPVLFGHTPCNFYNQTGYFIKTPNISSKNILDYNKIMLDTGSMYTNMLGVLNIETMQETYVK